MNIKVTGKFSTPEDFRIWAAEFNNPANVYVEFNDHFIYLYSNGRFRHQLNLQVFSKQELMDIINELDIEVKPF